MGRIFKFRAWDKQSKSMFSVRDINFCGEELDTYEMQGDWLEFDKIELIQFTGMLDDDKTEVYDGDIMAGEEYETDEGETTTIRALCVVRWDNENGRWVAVDHPSGDEYLLFDYSLAQNVIGNIYEHPHLLNNPE